MNGLQPLVGAGAPAAQRGEAYRKVMRIFMGGAYDLVSFFTDMSSWMVLVLVISGF